MIEHSHHVADVLPTRAVMIMAVKLAFMIPMYANGSMLSVAED